MITVATRHHSKAWKTPILEKPCYVGHCKFGRAVLSSAPPAQQPSVAFTVNQMGFKFLGLAVRALAGCTAGWCRMFPHPSQQFSWDIKGIPYCIHTPKPLVL